MQGASYLHIFHVYVTFIMFIFQLHLVYTSVNSGSALCIIVNTLYISKKLHFCNMGFKYFLVHFNGDVLSKHMKMFSPKMFFPNTWLLLKWVNMPLFQHVNMSLYFLPVTNTILLTRIFLNNSPRGLVTSHAKQGTCT